MTNKVNKKENEIKYRYVVGFYITKNDNSVKKINTDYIDRNTIVPIGEVEKEVRENHRGESVCRVDGIYILENDKIVGVLDKESA